MPATGSTYGTDVVARSVVNRLWCSAESTAWPTVTWTVLILRPRQRGRNVQAQHRQGLIQALAQAGRRPGVGAVEFLGQGPAAPLRPRALIRRGRRRSSCVPHCCEVVAADDLSHS